MVNRDINGNGRSEEENQPEHCPNKARSHDNDQLKADCKISHSRERTAREQRENIDGRCKYAEVIPRFTMKPEAALIAFLRR